MKISNLVNQYFKAYDHNQDGVITYGQAQTGENLRVMGFDEEDAYTAHPIMKAADANQDGQLNRKEFESFLIKFDTNQNGELDGVTGGLWARLFASKVERQNSEMGTFQSQYTEINLTDIRATGHVKLAENQSYRPELQRIFDAYDSNRDGEIAWKDLEQIRYQTGSETKTSTNSDGKEETETIDTRDVYSWHTFFAAADSDSNGRVTVAEASKLLSRFDANQNGKIDGLFFGLGGEVLTLARTYPEKSY